MVINIENVNYTKFVYFWIVYINRNFLFQFFHRYVAWYYLVHETPQEHPRITEAEKSYILESLGTSVNHDNSQSVPWKAILTSAPVWWVTISGWGSGWGIHTLNSEAPSYFNYIHGWNISAVSSRSDFSCNKNVKQ